MFPLKDDNPSRTTPVFTIGLIVINALVFVYQFSLELGGREGARAAESFIREFGLVPCRLTGWCHGPSDLPSPVLLNPGSFNVETINLMKMAKRPDGTIDLLPGATLQPQGAFSIEGEKVVFTADGHKLALKPRTPLLKEQQAAALFAFNPEYGRNAKAYEPDAALIKTLKGQNKQVRVLTVFGSWCPHCTQYVPRLLRVEQAIGPSKIKFDYYGVPSGQAMSRDPEVKRLSVKGVPTGIVYIGDTEVGRILGDGWASPEATLQNLLQVGASIAR